MERGVEAGDLRQPGPALEQERIGARLCGWCSGASGTNFLELGDDTGVDAHRLRILQPAVDDAVADRREFDGRRPAPRRKSAR